MTEKNAISRLRALALLGLFACTVVGALLAMAPVFSAPAHAQGFFDDRYPFQQDRWRRGGGYYPYRQPPVEDEKPPDYSRAPAPKKAETPPTSTIMVFGDAMSDWLAYGLEDALADTPEIGVVRKHKTYSGLIRYESRRDAPEWAQAAREAIVAEKPNYIVMMLGLNDRQAIREVIQPTPVKPQPGARPPAAPGAATPPAPREQGAAQKPDAQKPDPQKPDAQNAEAANPAADQDDEQQPAIAAPESARAGARQAAPQTLTHEYRSEKWEELYIKKIDDTIAALKTSGVPVYWVGLPPVRGARSTSDTQYLNELYRNRAEKAGIAYVEVWDGFIDEAGRFSVQGPDVEGQVRRLRTSDGVYFTKAGARKLAHYLERELRRDLNRVIPVALPAPEETPAQAATRPAAPAARPLVGPVVPLNANVSEAEELLGGATPRPASDGIAARALVKGEPVGGAAGRADDFAWPLRAPVSEYAGALPAGPPVAVVAAPKPAQPPPTRQAAAPERPSPPPNRVAQQPQYYPGYSNYPGYPRSGPYWRSPPSPWGGRGGGGGFFGLFR